MAPLRAPVAVFAGGGTGGHLFPALALADALRELRPDLRVVFVGARRGIEARVLPARGEEHLLLPVHGWQRGRIGSNAGVLPRLVASLLSTIRLFRRLRPSLVVTTGGYAAGPAGLVARLLRVPLAIQEQNAVPGITTRLLARSARQLHLAFEEAVEGLPATARGRVRIGGNPVREPAGESRAEARRILGLPEQGVLVLVTGGSQGSRALNRAVLTALGTLPAGAGTDPEPAPLAAITVLWATGPALAAEVVEGLGRIRTPAQVRVVPFLDDMPRALRAADLAVSRAGAMATSEFLAAGLPAILIPLPTSAGGHQERNARALEGAGCALHLPEAELSGEVLRSEILRLASDPDLLERMATRARERGEPGAARRIARDLATLLPPGTA